MRLGMEIMRLPVIGLFIFSALVLGTFYDAGANDSNVIELRMAHFMSPMHIQHKQAFIPFAQKVKELSKGKMIIHIYSGGVLGGPKQLPDSVKTGITDIALIVPSYTTGRFPRSSVLDLPYLFRSAVHATQVIYELYEIHFSGDFRDYKVLWTYTTTPTQLHSVTTPIHSLNDLQDMKIRTGSTYMSKALRLLGANPIGMPVPKLRASLEKKVIDGVLTPFCAVQDFGLFGLVKSITHVDLNVLQMVVVMNKKKFESLPEAAKKAIEAASGKAMGLHSARIYEDHDQAVLAKIQKSKAILITRLSSIQNDDMNKLLLGVEKTWIDETSRKGISAREILEAVHAAAR